MSLPFASEVGRCREAQRLWAARPVRDRLRHVTAFRHALVERADELLAAVETDVGRPPAEVTATDLVPVASACRFLERSAAKLLAPRRVGGRPIWLMGCRDTVHRRPHGLVGLIGTWNYPVFLSAVPLLQALAAGNGVLFKPSELAPKTGTLLVELTRQAGFPSELLQLLPADRASGPLLAEADIDFVHFTGSEAVGRKLAARLGERLIPSALELSGCDAVIVLEDADVELVARSAWYAATLNGGQTCMAARRAFVHRDVFEPFVAALRPLVERTPAAKLATFGQTFQAGELVGEAAKYGFEVVAGPAGEPGTVPASVLLGTADGEDSADDLRAFREPAFAPLLAVASFNTTDTAVSLHDAGPYRLTAAVFTRDAAKAAALAARLDVGSVVVNDVIVPTAHPGTPFGGRKASGWGVTQGAEGLLQLTVPQTVTVRSGTFRPHVENRPGAGDVAGGYLRLAHGRGLRRRWAGLRQLLRGMRGAEGSTGTRGQGDKVS